MLQIFDLVSRTYASERSESLADLSDDSATLAVKFNMRLWRNWQTR